MKRSRLLLMVAAATVALGTGAGATALAAAPSPDRTVGPNHDVQGLVPSKHSASKTVGSGGNLVYHTGGSVMVTNTTHAIYWVPAGYTVSGTYESLIDGFFTNVAADSTTSTNVYASDTQYYQNVGGTQYIGYNSSFGGSTVDTTPFPASGCSDTVAQTSVCLSDTQLQAEISKVVAAKGWPKGLGNLYFVFTPRGVGSCINSSTCAFSYYCAYHSHIGSGSSVILYANQPYTDTVAANCDSGQSPNGDAAADSTINVASHEHNEAITDALGNAWFDRRGNENGDKCAWNFGATAGSSNQTIGTGHYYLQQEWSNRSSACVLQGT